MGRFLTGSQIMKNLSEHWVFWLCPVSTVKAYLLFKHRVVWSDQSLRKIILYGLEEDQNGIGWQQLGEMLMGCFPKVVVDGIRDGVDTGLLVVDWPLRVKFREDDSQFHGLDISLGLHARLLGEEDVWGKKMNYSFGTLEVWWPIGVQDSS